MRERLKQPEPEYDPTAMAQRGELVKHMLRNVASEHIDAKDIVHALVIGLTDDGTPMLFHSYGELELTEMRDFLGALHAQCVMQCLNEEAKGAGNGER